MSRTHWVIIFSLVVVVVIVGAVLAARQNSSTSTTAKTTNTPASTTQTVTTVTYNGTGFTPPEISVKAGTTINFTNTSSDQMWVEGIVNGVAPALSGFNQQKATAKGTYYSFTFNDKGTYKYDNHVMNNQTGMVTVL